MSGEGGRTVRAQRVNRHEKNLVLQFSIFMAQAQGDVASGVSVAGASSSAGPPAHPGLRGTTSTSPSPAPAAPAFDPSAPRVKEVCSLHHSCLVCALDVLMHCNLLTPYCPSLAIRVHSRLPRVPIAQSTVNPQI